MNKFLSERRDSLCCDPFFSGHKVHEEDTKNTKCKASQRTRTVSLIND